MGDKLLDIAESSQVPIEPGCRMGMCGSDPVRILEGAENLSAMRSAERRTLERLGLGAGCRMACVSRVQGPGRRRPASDARGASERRPSTASSRPPRDAIGRVVVIGAGVAGVTAAEELRRVLPDAELTLIGDEPYAFYNRMGITRLVSESVSIESLYLNRHDWAESRRDRLPARAGCHGDRPREPRGETSRTGNASRTTASSSRPGRRPLVPPIEGFGARAASCCGRSTTPSRSSSTSGDAAAATAVVVGAGLLGLEAAYYIAQLDVRVLVLDRGPWPLSRQLDEQAGALLWEMLHDLGIELLARTRGAAHRSPTSG